MKTTQKVSRPCSSVSVVNFEYVIADWVDLTKVNLFYATGLFLYLLKTSENQTISVFRGYRKIPVPWNGFCYIHWSLSIPTENIRKLTSLKGRETAHPANIYLFKVAIETLEKGVKYVQS